MAEQLGALIIQVSISSLFFVGFQLSERVKEIICRFRRVFPKSLRISISRVKNLKCSSPIAAGTGIYVLLNLIMKTLFRGTPFILGTMLGVYYIDEYGDEDEIARIWKRLMKSDHALLSFSCKYIMSRRHSE